MGAQLYVSVGREEAALALGMRAPGTPMRTETLTHVWCATKPLGALLIAALLESNQVGPDHSAATMAPWLDLPKGLTVRDLLAHRTPLVEPRLLDMALAPPSHREKLLRSAITAADWAGPSGLSETAAWFILGVMASQFCESPLDSWLHDAAERALGPGLFWFTCPHDIQDLRTKAGLYFSDLDRPTPRPWSYDHAPLSLGQDVTFALGGFASALGLGRFGRALLDTLRLGSGPLELPSATLLRDLLARPRHCHDSLLGRKAGFAGSFMVDLAGHGFGNRPSASAFAAMGLLSRSFVFADPESDLVVAFTANGIDERPYGPWIPAILEAAYEDLALS